MNILKINDGERPISFLAISAAGNTISVKFCVGKQFLAEFRQWDNHPRLYFFPQNVFRFPNAFWASASGAFPIVSDTLGYILVQFFMLLLMTRPKCKTCIGCRRWSVRRPSVRRLSRRHISKTVRRRSIGTAEILPQEFNGTIFNNPLWPVTWDVVSTVEILAHFHVLLRPPVRLSRHTTGACCQQSATVTTCW